MSALRGFGRRRVHSGHLVRRFVGSLSRRQPDDADQNWAGEVLGQRALQLWSSMRVQDRRHSLLVAQRLVAAVPDLPREVVAAALLHDVGKNRCGLGTWGRVAATLVGPHGRRFRLYHAHESLGAEMAAAAGCSLATVEAIGGGGAFAEDLRRADDV